ncbi:hypothetical protein BH24DEI2_BH24DEI2_00880 [soil metagenome]
MPDVAQTYIELAFGIEQHLPGYIDGYFGPEAWKRTEKLTLEDLEQDARTLAAEVAGLEDFSRRTFLTAQVRAMQTSIKLLQGHDVPYAEEVRELYDVEAERVPEAVFEAAIAELDGLLPGSGDVAAREQALRAKLVVPKEKIEEVSSLIVAELKKRTLARFPLPAEESFELQLVSDKPWSGYNWYLGEYRSRVDVNTDLPVYLTGLPNLIAHEVYPGHHTEHALKEQRLLNEAGHLEHALLLINAPECVVSEGIATWALQMVMAEDELADWLADDLAPPLGMDGEEVRRMLAVGRAKEALRGVSGNAALLLYEEGRSEADVLDYIKRYALRKPEEAQKSLKFLQNPMFRSYIFTYTAGYDLLEPLLAGKDADTWFSRLLQEPVTPGGIRDWVST